MSYADLGTSIYDAKFINEEQRDIATYTAEQIGYARKETPLKDCTCSGFRQKVYSEEFSADPRYNEVLPAEFVESWKYMFPEWFQGFFSEKNMLPTRTLLSMRKCQLCIANLEAASFHRVIGWDSKKVEIPVVTKEVEKVADQSIPDAQNDAEFEKEFLEYISQDHAVYVEETSDGPYIRHHSDEPDYEIQESYDHIEASQHDPEESQHSFEDSEDSEDSSSDSSNNGPWDPDVLIPSIESDDTEGEGAKYSHEFSEEEESDDEYCGDASDEEGSEEDYGTVIVSDLLLRQCKLRLTDQSEMVARSVAQRPFAISHRQRRPRLLNLLSSKKVHLFQIIGYLTVESTCLCLAMESIHLVLSLASVCLKIINPSPESVCLALSLESICLLLPLESASLTMKMTNSSQERACLKAIHPSQERV
jgi:hypothetical protein